MKRLTHAYPVYDVNYRTNLDTVLNYLDSIEHVYPIGRQGIFNYCGMADAMDMGFHSADHIIEKRSGPDWITERRRFEQYVTID